MNEKINKVFELLPLKSNILHFLATAFSQRLPAAINSGNYFLVADWLETPGTQVVIGSLNCLITGVRLQHFVIGDSDK